jgi:hypothetical protein
VKYGRNIRNPKPEIRRKKENPKSELSSSSDFELWFSFGFLVSDFGFEAQRLRFCLFSDRVDNPPDLGAFGRWRMPLVNSGK